LKDEIEKKSIEKYDWNKPWSPIHNNYSFF
jgi:hypothetical protein